MFAVRQRRRGAAGLVDVAFTDRHGGVSRAAVRHPRPARQRPGAQRRVRRQPGAGRCGLRRRRTRHHAQVHGTRRCRRRLDADARDLVGDALVTTSRRRRAVRAGRRLRAGRARRRRQRVRRRRARRATGCGRRRRAGDRRRRCAQLGADDDPCLDRAARVRRLLRGAGRRCAPRSPPVAPRPSRARPGAHRRSISVPAVVSPADRARAARCSDVSRCTWSLPTSTPTVATATDAGPVRRDWSCCERRRPMS